MCVLHPAVADMSMPLFPGQSLEINNRPHYARSDRGDRDRLLPGKRDAWAVDRASAAPSYHRASSTNGSPLGPPSKRRPPGRQTFYGENGRHSTSRADPSPGYGGASPIDNSAGRKVDRDAYYSSGSSSILGTSTGYNSSAGTDHRSKDVDERHNRESCVQSGDGKESASSAVMEQLARPYHSQVFSECNNSWDRDGRPRSSSLSGWDVTQRGERWLRGKPDMFKRSGSFSQFDTGSWHGGDGDLDARADRYSGSTREPLFSESSNKDLISIGHEWKLRDRPATSAAATWNSGMSTPNGLLKDGLAKQPGVQDVSLPLPSPQQSPFSSPTSVSLDGGRDEGGFSSPRKRPRLGWGQGLAKYEKKKVVESEDVVAMSASVKGETLDSYRSPCGELPSPVVVPYAGPMPSLVSVASEIVDGNNEDCFGVTDTVSVEQAVALRASEEKTFCNLVLGNGKADLLEFGELGSCGGSVLPIPLAPLRSADMEQFVERLGTGPHLSAEVSEMPSSHSSPVPKGQHKEGAGKGRLIVSSKGAASVEIQFLESEAVVLGKDRLAAVPDSVEGGLPTVKDETLLPIEQHAAGCEHDLTSSGVVSASGAQGLLALAEAPLGADAVECESALVLKEALVSASPGSVGENLVDPEAFVSIHDEPMESEEPNSAEYNTSSHLDSVKKVQSILVVEDGQEVIASSMCTEEESRVQPVTFFKPSKVKEETGEDHDSSISALLLENRQAALQASKSLSHLLPQCADLGNEKLYSCPLEASVWQTNALSHDRVKHQLREKLLEQKRCGIFKERALAIRYRALKEVWCREQLGLCQRRDRSKIVRRGVEADRRNSTTFCQRSSSRLRSTPCGAVRPDALSEEVQVVKRLMSDSLEQARSVERMPTMILDEKNRFFQKFVTKNGLVEDPVSVERERRHVNPWTDAEKKLFLDKYALYGKNFQKVAMFLEHKTTADCVEFYYRNQKSEDFEKIHRRQQLKKRRDYSRSSGSYLATTMSANNSQGEANAVRVEALTMAVASASAAALVPSGREPVKSVRTGPHKSADRGKSIGLDIVTREGLASVKSVGAKESKAASSLLAVAAGSPVFGTNSCSLSSAASLPKSCHERYNLKSGVAGGPPMRNVIVDHSAGLKGVRSMQVRHEPMKATPEEIESQWTEHEKQLFTHAVATAGKNFKVIALQVGTKTQGQCRAFFSKARKSLGLDQLVERVESTMAVVEVATVDGKDLAEVESGKIEDFAKEVLDAPATEPQAMDIDTAELEVICGSIVCKKKATDDIVTDHRIGVEADLICAPTPAAHVEEGCGLVDATGGASKGAVTPTDNTTEISSPDLSSEAELNPKNPHPPTQEVKVVAKDEPDESKVCKSVVTRRPTSDEGILKDVLGTPSVALNSESSCAAKLELKICEVLVKPDPESPSTGVSFVNEPVCVHHGRPVTVQLAGTAVPMPPVHIVREKVSRSSVGGESKPRREPTSWTQEEKEKFAEIIRKHGKDWTLLHESLPAKSLIQIKTYFQNSKAKLGFAPPEGSGAGSRGGGSRKRKADDSDTSSNAGSGGAVSQQKGSGVVDELSLKVHPGSAGVASAENLAFALFGRGGGQTPEESVSNLQKLLRQMCTPNGYASQTGLFPLPASYHPVFAPPLQRVAQLSLQQQQVTSSQPLGLQQTGVSQHLQTHQSILHAQLQQQQTVMVRKHQIQQQQASQIMAHQQAVSQLQQQVSQGGHLHQHSVQHAMQQAQTVQCQQALHGQVQVQAAVQSPTSSRSQPQQVQQQLQVSQKQVAVGQTVGSSVVQQQQTHLHHFTHNQQHPNQLLHLQSQVVQGLPPSSLQHQHFQQTTQKHQDQSTNHVSPLQLQQQLQQVGKLQLQKHLQAVQQGQSQQQQSGGQLQFHHLEQQQVEQQQMLQQLHQGEQGLLREVMQASTSHNTADLNGELELRSTGPLPRQLVRAGEVENPGQVCSSSGPVIGKGHDQMKNVAGPCSEGLRLGDVKLFGQSLLCQPSSGSVVQPSLTVRASGTPNGSGERPAVLQGTLFANSTSGQLVASIQPSVSLSKASCFKELGPVSSFGRVGVSVENRQPNWPTVLAGNLGMWSSMLSSVQGGAQVSGDLETQGVQEVAMCMADRFSREVRDSDDTRGVHVTDTMSSQATFPGKLQHIDQLRGIQTETQRNEALAGTVQALDHMRGNALVDQSSSHLGVVAGDLLSRSVEAERTNETGSQMASGSGERPPSAAVLQCRSGHASDFGVASLSNLPSLNGLQASGGLQGTGQTAAIPRQVLDALMKIAEWHNRTVQCAAAAAAATNAAQARGGGSNDTVELHPSWAGEHGFRREPHGGSSTLSPEVAQTAGASNPSAALAAAAAAAVTMGQTHLVTVPEVLQHVRDSGMYFGPTAGHLMQGAGTGHVGNPVPWVPANPTAPGGGLHPASSDSQQQRIILQPIISSFRSPNLPWGPSGSEEHLRPCSSESSARDSSVDHHTAS